MVRIQSNCVVRAIAPVLIVISATAAAAAAQTDSTGCVVRLSGADFVDASADLVRMIDIQLPTSQHSFLMRRISDRAVYDVCSTTRSVRDLARHLSLTAIPARGAAVLPVDVRINYNGAYPRDWNDGALWTGVGLGSSIGFGAAFRWGLLEAGVAPIITHHNNASFTTIPYGEPTVYSRYIHPWHGHFIDLPQRFGSDGDSRIDPGQSYIRIHTAGVRAGISHENLAWGPARRNPLLLSGTAGGFPHVFMESSRPLDVGLADAEFQLFWGRLSESEYFDKNADNNHRALAGALATLRPKGLDGLYIGAGHLHMQTWWPTTSAAEVLLGPYTGIDPDSVGLPRDLRLFSLFMRWAAAPAGLEIYGEWARQDSWEHWIRLLNPVDAAQAYTLGLQKVVRRGDNAVRFSAEISHLSDALPHRDFGRGLQTYYVSPHVTQGHTHRGQLLGAPIGPGSEAQFIGTDVFWSGGRTGFSIERVRYDDDAYYAVWAQVHGPHGHDTEMSFRAAHLFATPLFSVEAELGYSFRYSRSLIRLHAGNTGLPDHKENNIGIRLAGRWLPAWSWDR